MSASGERADPLALRLALLAFPRRFRHQRARDLIALCADLDAGGRPAGRVRTAWNVVRNGLGARVDDLRRVLGGGSRVPSSGGGGPRGVGALGADVIFGLRVLRKSPLFTLVAVASLAIGIGANTAVFSVLEATVLRLLPVESPEELVVLHAAASFDDWPDVSTSGWMLTNDAGHGESSSFSYPFYERLRDSEAPFRDVTAFAQLYSINVGVEGSAELVRGQVVAGNYFELLGVRPHRGRLLTPDDDRPGAPAAAVISYDYWQTRFGGLDAAIGSEVQVNRNGFTIVGVTPPGFHGALQLGSSPPVTLPLAHQAPVMRDRELLARGDYWWLHVLGRLRDGATLEQAEVASGLVFAQSLEADLEVTESPMYVRALPGARGMTEARSLVIEPLQTVTVVVVAVLLIACVNLANLLLARSSSRAREIAVRLSLGASRWRVTRQLLAESLLLSFLGAAAGLVLAFGLRDLLLPVLGLHENELGGGLALRVLDARVLGFTVLAAGVTGLLFGIVPALRATRVDLTPALKDEPLRGGGTRPLLGRALLVVQVALSLGLLVVAGLFAGSLVELRSEATGFDGAGVLTVTIDPRASGYEDEELRQYYADALRRLRGIPGAVAVGTASHVPVSGTTSTTSMRVEGYEPEPDERMRTYVNVVDDGFFDVFGIAPRQGRAFDDRDARGAARVTVVNQTLVERYLPGTNPIGRHIGFGSGENASEWEIVGVVDDVKYQSLSDSPLPAVHIPYAQLPSGLAGQTLSLRAAGDPLDLAAPVREALRELDPDVSIASLAPHRDLVRDNVAVERTFALLASGLSAVALLLSCIGLYGMLAYNVSRRTREFGVRMAVGARRHDVVRLVMGELRTVALGALLGVAGAWFAVRGLESQLYGLEPNDPRVMVLAVGLLLVVAAAAAFLPARQAAGLDPVEALRSE